MKLVSVLALLCCFASGAVAKKPVTKKTSVSACEGAKFKTATKDEIIKLVVSALEKGDKKALTKYFPCEFMAALPDSDFGGVTSKAHTALPLLIKASASVKWTGKGDDYGTQFNVNALNSTKQETLIFRKDDKSGWYWAGYSSSDAKLLEKILGKPLEHETGD